MELINIEFVMRPNGVRPNLILRKKGGLKREVIAIILLCWVFLKFRIMKIKKKKEFKCKKKKEKEVYNVYVYVYS